MRAAIIAAVLAFAAHSAGAIVMPPSCGYDTVRDELVPLGDPRSDRDVFVSPVGTGFVSWSVDIPTPRYVVQNCKTRDFVAVGMPGNQTAMDRYNEMVFGDGEYSLRQIGEEMGKLGATARLGQDEFGQCACEQIYGMGSGQ